MTTQSILVESLVGAGRMASYWEQLASWAERLRFAYAWLGSSHGHAVHWKHLATRKIDRSVVGTHFAQTEPHALRTLADAGAPVRVIADSRGVFHPKLMIAYRGDEARVLIGSSNFTAGGFLTNSELNLLLHLGANHPYVAQWESFIDKAWQRADEITIEWLDWYEDIHRKRPITREHQPSPVRATSAILRLEWPEYFELIARQDGRFTRADWQMHVFPHPSGSYIQEAEICHEALAAAGSFHGIPESLRQRVAGWGRDTTGYFGHMGGAGYYKQVTREQPELIDSALDHIPADGPVSAAEVRSALAAFDRIHGFGIATSSRLLCLKRPDWLLPVTQSSRQEFRNVFGSRGSSAKAYLEALEQSWQAPWFQSERPAGTTQQRVWDLRTALLDSVLYEGGGPGGGLPPNM